MKRPRKPKPPPLGLNGLGADDQRRLTGIVGRIERLQDERKVLDENIRSVFAEAKAMNFDLGTIRRTLRERAMSAEKRQMAEALLDSYRHALGMLADTPLGRSVLERDGDPVQPKRRRSRATAGGDDVAAESGGAATPAAPPAAPWPDAEAAGQTVADMRALRRDDND